MVKLTVALVSGIANGSDPSSLTRIDARGNNIDSVGDLSQCEKVRGLELSRNSLQGMTQGYIPCFCTKISLILISPVT